MVLRVCSPRTHGVNQENRKRSGMLSQSLSVNDHLDFKNIVSSQHRRHKTQSEQTRAITTKSNQRLFMKYFPQRFFKTCTHFLFVCSVSAADCSSTFVRFRSDLISVRAVKTNPEYPVTRLNLGIGLDMCFARCSRSLQRPVRVVVRHQ